MPTRSSATENLADPTRSPFLFVLMGASNLARGYSALVNSLRRCLNPHPVEVLHAMGPGRAYCAKGGVFHVRYPAIGTCGILDAAKERARKARKVTALITDIGSDIMYNVPVAEITSCLGTLMRDLEAMGADVFVNPIPMTIEEDVSELQFRMLRAIYFPRSPVEYVQAADGVRQINEFLRRSVGGRIHLLPSVKDFCGADKIHYSMIHSHQVWTQVVQAMGRVLPAGEVAEVGLFSAWRALFANMGRLFFCDMLPLGKKIPGTF